MAPVREDLVECLAEIEENVAWLESAYHCGDEQLRERYRELIASGRHFLCSEINGGLTFAPSRMIGYRSNTFATRDTKGQGNGTATSQRLNQLLAEGHARNTAVEHAFQSFCRSRSITPHAREGQREYWTVGNARHLIAEVIAEGDQIAAMLFDATLEETTRQQLIAARKGQGLFRINVSRLWNNSCGLTGCSTPALLRASHIKPWAYSNNQERLDPMNGLLLAAHVDALFDRGLISFEDDGALIYSSQLCENDRRVLALPRRLRAPAEGHRQYLQIHRETVFDRMR